MYGVLLGLKVICGQAKKYVIEMTFISEIKNKIRRTGMHNIYPVFQPLASQFLHRVYYDL